MLTAKSVTHQVKESLRSADTYRIKIGDDEERKLSSSENLAQYIRIYMKYRNTSSSKNLPCKVTYIPDNKLVYSGNAEGAMKWLGVEL